MATWVELATTWVELGPTWLTIDTGGDLVGTSTTGTTSTGDLSVVNPSAVNLAGTSTTLTGSTGALEVAASGAPPTPTGLAIGSITSTSMTPSWNAAVGAEFYDVERQRWDGANWVESTVFTGIVATSLLDTPLEGGTQYRYRVRAGKAAP